jgi:hypothetical protein
MSDELREILEDLIKYFINNPFNLSEPSQMKIAKALSAIREAIPRMVIIDKISIKSCLRSMRDTNKNRGYDAFISYQDGKISKGYLLDLIISALCEQVGSIVKVKEGMGE